ncbi:hypothetical protein BG000_010313 [Podila horticola]|nr:hypothetical protein BG000_010313 [Podila horticola]
MSTSNNTKALQARLSVGRLASNSDSITSVRKKALQKENLAPPNPNTNNRGGRALTTKKTDRNLTGLPKQIPDPVHRPSTTPTAPVFPVFTRRASGSLSSQPAHAQPNPFGQPTSSFEAPFSVSPETNQHANKVTDARAFDQPGQTTLASASDSASIPGKSLIQNEDDRSDEELSPELDGDVYAFYSSIHHTEETEKDLRDLLANIHSTEDEFSPQDRTGTPEGMSDTIVLLEHQKIGLTWLQKMEDGTNKGGILADDMAYKTLEILHELVLPSLATEN